MNIALDSNVKAVEFNGSEVDVVEFNGVEVWRKAHPISDNWITKTWIGLTEFGGNRVWTDGDNIYYSNNSEQYVLDKSTSTWAEKTWTGLTSFRGDYVWTDGDNIYYSGGS